MLVTTFMTALFVKDMHIHDTSYHGHDTSMASHQAELTEDCYVCNFVMHTADTPEVMTFVPVVTAKLISRVVFCSQTVYRTVESINTHSPPCEV